MIAPAGRAPWDRRDPASPQTRSKAAAPSAMPSSQTRAAGGAPDDLDRVADPQPAKQGRDVFLRVVSGFKPSRGGGSAERVGPKQATQP